jgi:hypothetical protein
MSIVLRYPNFVPMADAIPVVYKGRLASPKIRCHEYIEGYVVSIIMIVIVIIGLWSNWECSVVASKVLTVLLPFSYFVLCLRACDVPLAPPKND